MGGTGELRCEWNGGERSAVNGTEGSAPMCAREPCGWLGSRARARALLPPATAGHSARAGHSTLSSARTCPARSEASVELKQSQAISGGLTAPARLEAAEEQRLRERLEALRGRRERRERERHERRRRAVHDHRLAVACLGLASLEPGTRREERSSTSATLRDDRSPPAGRARQS